MGENQIQSQGTTYNLPSYRGDLFAATPVETPLLTALGGLTGGKSTRAVEFEWQGYDLRDAGNRAVLEGQVAGVGSVRKRFNINNVIQSHQESFQISDVRKAALQNFGGTNNGQADPVTDEVDLQINIKLQEIARDIEWAIVNQTYAKPADNTQARKTRGLAQAITTNVVTNGTAADLSDDLVRAALKSMRNAGGARRTDRVTFVGDAEQVLRLNDIYIGKGKDAKTPADRSVGGVNLQTIVTPFGAFNVLMHDFIPAGELHIYDLAELDLVFLETDQADVYVEKLARTGAFDAYQVTAHWGLEYGNERLHAKITGLKG